MRLITSDYSNSVLLVAPPGSVPLSFSCSLSSILVLTASLFLTFHSEGSPVLCLITEVVASLSSAIQSLMFMLSLTFFYLLIMRCLS